MVYFNSLVSIETVAIMFLSNNALGQEQLSPLCWVNGLSIVLIPFPCWYYVVDSIFVWHQ
jgi:hypothetical protein